MAADGARAARPIFRINIMFVNDLSVLVHASLKNGNDATSISAVIEALRAKADALEAVRDRPKSVEPSSE